MKKQRGRERTVEIEHEGKRYTGHLIVEGSVVTLMYGDRHQSTQVGGGTAEGVARMLLRELVAARNEP